MLLAVTLLAASPAAQAEVARLRAGTNLFGQGWLFLDRDGRCKVLTAGHVVAPNGAAVEVMVLDRRNRELETDPPEILALPPDGEVAPDLALLPVRTAGDSDACSRSRLSMIGVDRRVQSMRSAVIETTALTETQVVPVERVASLRDRAGGEVFVVRPRDPAVVFSQGWSGSILRDEDGPLGVVVAAPDATEAVVLRVDMLARLTRMTPPRPPMADFNRIVVNRGHSPDAAAGPSGALDQSRRAWAVQTDRGWVEVQIAAPEPRTVRRVVAELASESPDQLLGLDVAVGLRTQAGWRFERVRSCRLNTPARSLTCEILEQRRSVLQIALQFQGRDGRAVVRSIHVE